MCPETALQCFFKPARSFPETEQTGYLVGESQVQKKKARPPNLDGKVWEKISFALSLLRMIKSPALNSQLSRDERLRYLRVARKKKGLKGCEGKKEEGEGWADWE